MMAACCTKMDCPCERIVIDIKINPGDFTYEEKDAFKLVITDKQFNRQDSVKAFFAGDGTYQIAENTMSLLSKVEDHNFLLKNSMTLSVDTISEITNVRRDSAIHCNDCFLARERPLHCDNITSKKLKLNGKIVDDYTVVISR